MFELVHPVRRSDKRLFEMNTGSSTIVISVTTSNASLIAVPDEMLGHRRLGARRNAVSLDHAVLHVRGRNRQAVPLDLAVEKPSHKYSACGEGCGRPSIQMIRSSRPNTPSSVYANNSCVTGSVRLVIRILGPGPRMKYTAGCGCAIRSGRARIEASQCDAFCRAASLIGKPCVIAELSARPAMRLIFVDACGPLT